MNVEREMGKIVKLAKKKLKAEGVLPPFLLIQFDDDELGILPCLYSDNRSKDLFFRFVREQIFPEIMP